MTPERLTRMREVLARRQFDLTVFLERVHKPHNFAAVVRTCDAVGIARAHAVPGREGLPALNHTSQGAQRWVDIQRHASTAAGVTALRAGGLRLLAAHFSDRAVDFRDVDYTQPTCIMLGTEKFGVSEDALAACEGEIIIPMNGMVQSLNVSVAAAIILFEAQRQREQAGLYAPRAVDDDPDRAGMLAHWIQREHDRRARGRAGAA